jgi:hypothetical protein
VSCKYIKFPSGVAIVQGPADFGGHPGRQFCEQTLKMDPAEFDLDAVNRVEVYGTDISDPGEDYCEFRVIDCHNKVMAIRREMGY